jgi:hypothetical protein
MANKQGGGCNKRQHKKDRVTAGATTRRNKERRAKTHKTRMEKLKRKQEKRTKKLTEKLKESGIEWKVNKDRRPSYEIRYMQKRLREVLR